MINLIYENSWAGFLCAVFAAFPLKESCKLSRKGDISFIYDSQDVITDQTRAQRVEAGMTRLGAEVSAICYRAWLSEKENIEDDILASLRRGFEVNADPFPLLMYPEVRRTVLASRHVGMEAHRFLGLTRLKHVRDDLYAADFTHDYNLLPLMGTHFADRFGDQRLIIRDIERRHALICGGGVWEIRALPNGEIPPLPEDGEFERSWRSYFEAIANPARKNLRLQMKFVPLKYRAHLTEFQ